MFADRAVEQIAFLRDDRDVVAQGVLRHLRDILAVDQNLAVLDVISTHDEVRDSRFACAALADEADLLSGGHGEIETVQHQRVVAPIAERYFLERDRGGRPRDTKRDGIRHVHNRVRLG